MKKDGSGAALGAYTVNSCLVVPIDAGVDEDSLREIGREILELAHSNGARGVLLNVSAADILGTDAFTILKGIMTGVSLLGAKGVLVGLQPGVVSAWVDRNFDCHDLATAITMEDAFELVGR